MSNKISVYFESALGGIDDTSTWALETGAATAPPLTSSAVHRTAIVLMDVTIRVTALAAVVNEEEELVLSAGDSQTGYFHLLTQMRPQLYLAALKVVGVAWARLHQDIVSRGPGHTALNCDISLGFFRAVLIRTAGLTRSLCAISSPTANSAAKNAIRFMFIEVRS